MDGRDRYRPFRGSFWSAIAACTGTPVSDRHRPPQAGESSTRPRVTFLESYRPLRGSFSSAIAAWYTNAATTTAFFFRSSIGRVS